MAHIQHQDGPGGGPVVILNLVKGFCDEYDVTVLHGGAGMLARECPKLGARSIRVPIDRLFKCVWGVWVLALRIWQTKADVVFLQGQWAGPVGAIACRLAGIHNVIYIAHWPAFYHTGNLYRRLRGYWSEKIPCLLARRIVVLSEGNRRAYLSRGLARPEKMTLIHNCVSRDNPSDADIDSLRSEIRQTAKGPHVVFVGRMDEQKRPDWMLKAWAEVPKELRQDAHLWMIGDGPLREQLESLRVQLDLGSSCTLVGSRADGRTWLCASDIVAMSSLFEGHALVPLEAMMGERPIVAFRVDGIEDSVLDKETGFLAPPGDTTALAASLTRLLTDESARSTMGKKGKEFCLAHFSPEKWLDAYRNLLDSTPTNPQKQPR